MMSCGGAFIQRHAGIFKARDAKDFKLCVEGRRSKIDSRQSRQNQRAGKEIPVNALTAGQRCSVIDRKLVHESSFSQMLFWLRVLSWLLIGEYF
jgi:hypothetical protein